MFNSMLKKSERRNWHTHTHTHKKKTKKKTWNKKQTMMPYDKIRKTMWRHSWNMFILNYAFQTSYSVQKKFFDIEKEI
jgi:hypothetical protein